MLHNDAENTRTTCANVDPHLASQMATHLAQHGRPDDFYVVRELAARPVFQPTITSRRRLHHINPAILAQRPVLVVVAEKPMHADRLAQMFAARWPGHQLFFVLTYTFGLSKLALPAPNPLATYPHVADPVWQFRSTFPSAPVWAPHGEDVVPTDLPVEFILATADEIILACEADSTGAVASHTLLQECLSADAARQLRRVVALTALDEQHIEEAYSAGLTTLDPEYQGWLSTGLARRFFEFNYNANALAAQGPVLARLGLKAPQQVVSKHALQLLYHLRREARAPLTEASLLQLMATGFDVEGLPRTPLGSVLSRMAIIDALLVAGLIEKDSRDFHRVTRLGQEFLSALPTKCEDPALPAKLSVWCANWPESRGAMVAYLQEFFSPAA